MMKTDSGVLLCRHMGWFIAEVTGSLTQIYAEEKSTNSLREKLAWD